MNKLIFLLVTICCSVEAVEYMPIYEADLSSPALKITTNEQGQWLEITASEWHDVVFTDEGQKSYLYRLGYNYKKQQGFLRTYTPDMKLVSEVFDEKTGGMVSREELLLAFDIFKADPKIHAVLTQESEPINIFGGFGYADKLPEEACYLGQRCVHVFAHTKSKSMVAHAIVKLNDQSIPYPDFDGINNKKEVIK